MNGNWLRVASMNVLVKPKCHLFLETNEKRMDISVTVHSKLGRISQDQTHTARIQVNIPDSHHEYDLDFS
jgi:hypothetical protein